MVSFVWRDEMLKIKEWLAGLLGEFIALFIGYVFCLFLLISSYFVGLWVGPHLIGGDEHKEFFGVLSSVTVIWIYEHRIALERWERLVTKLDNLRR